MGVGEPWFKADRATIGHELQSQVQIVERSPCESTRRNNLLYDLELYLGRKMTSLYAISGGDYERLWNPDSLVFNVCYSIVNTIRNRICSFRPRAQFLPNGGDYKARRGARDRTAMSDSWAQDQAYQAEASLALRDMLTGDGGVLKVYKDSLHDTDGKLDSVCVGRFPSWEFLFDEAESIYRMPECAYHTTYIPIEQAEARYKIDRQTLAAGICGPPEGIIYASNRELIRCVEAWKRGPNGRHLTVVADQVIGEVEEWKYDGFPLVQNTFDEGQVGFWGTGAVTPLRSIQLELNEMQTTLREAFRNAATKIIAYQQNENAIGLLTNAYVMGVPYVNTPPTVMTPPAVDLGHYQYINLLKTQAYETLGVSQFLANGTRQKGSTSAVAIQEESELQSDRLANLSQVWETMRVDTAVWWNRFGIELARAGVPVKWKAMHRGAFKELVFGDLEAEWEIRPTPTSVFGQSLSGRLDKAVELIKGGFMSKEDALRALDMPDIAPIVDLQLAQSYGMEWLIDDILEEGIYRQPDKYFDPKSLDSYAKNRYFLALSDGSAYPDKHMSLMRRLIDTNQRRLAKQMAAPPMQQPAPPALQGASPEMLEQSAPGARPAA
jgi:hypothetical protein